MIFYFVKSNNIFIFATETNRKIGKTDKSQKMDEQKKEWGGARPGAGRKKSGQTRATIGISVSKSYADMLKQAAADENTTPGRYIENHLPLNNI